MKAYYTYLWLRNDGTPYYVGKGHGNRAFTGRRNAGQLPPPKSSELILVQEYSSEIDALVAEVFLISYYGRKDKGTGVLRNMTDGGDGTSGIIHSEEWYKKQRDCRLGKKTRPHREESKQQTRNSLLGRKHTEERRRNQSLAHKGKSWTEAQRLAHVGRKHSEEHKRKQSESLKRAYAEGRRNSSFGATRHVVSDATRRKLSESNGVFTKTQLDEILRIRKTGVSLRKIAEMFGVSRPSIGGICSGRTYRR
jgi:predicted XRE-type DNA-binding protein